MTNHKNDCRNNQSLKFTFEDVNENAKKSIPNPSKWIFPKISKKMSLKSIINDNNKRGITQID